MLRPIFFSGLALIAALLSAFAANARSSPVSEASAGKWAEGVDKTLVITYFRSRQEWRERDNKIGLLLINHRDAPQQARVRCSNRDHLSDAFTFTLDLKANERRQLFIEDDFISGYENVSCQFTDYDVKGLDFFRMNGTPSLEEARRPAFDNRVDPPAEPVINFGEWR